MPRIRNKRLLVVYQEKDYNGGFDEKGPLNLKLLERTLIIKAANRCKGDRFEMAQCLGISMRCLFDKLTNHSLTSI